MQFTTFTVNPFSENTYLVHNENDALLVDPGFMSQPEKTSFLKKLDQLNVQLKAVLLTHAHVDHILGVSFIRGEFDIPFYINHTDLYLWKNASEQAAMFGFRLDDFDFTPRELQPEGNISVEGVEFYSYATPGHAPEHLSFYFEEDNTLLAGDTLFKQSIGRTDLYKGDFEVLKQSIQTLYTLPDETRVLPGHGPETTIGFEKKNNAFVRG